ncbi:hypothetical protein DLR11_24760, partial [Salmonella enterica subsp. salamae]|nr:hypothetical protein [Salmonella enterica subsp. salamae]
FWLCQPTPRWLMPPRLLWSPYLRCSPQMLRMRLPVWLMRLTITPQITVFRTAEGSFATI